jgi:hypothetical protein
MCRTGGRRCPSSGGRSKGGSSASSAGGRLSADDAAYMERVADLDRREAAGESITDIMAADRNQSLQRQIEEMTREAEQARAEEARGW